MWKKMLVLFFVSMLLAPIALSAQSTTFRFRMSSDGTGLCIDKYTGDEQYVVIQSEYDGLPVKEIGKSAFYKSKVISVYIPDSVETIGFSSFEYCENLTEARLPKNLKRIDVAAFAYCKNLTSLDIQTENPVVWPYSGSVQPFEYCRNLPMSTQIKLIKLGYKGSF